MQPSLHLVHAAAEYDQDQDAAGHADGGGVSMKPAAHISQRSTLSTKQRSQFAGQGVQDLARGSSAKPRRHAAQRDEEPHSQLEQPRTWQGGLRGRLLLEEREDRENELDDERRPWECTGVKTVVATQMTRRRVAGRRIFGRTREEADPLLAVISLFEKISRMNTHTDGN